jgi:hypothetical protein
MRGGYVCCGITCPTRRDDQPALAAFWAGETISQFGDRIGRLAYPAATTFRDRRGGRLDYWEARWRWSTTDLPAKAGG